MRCRPRCNGQGIFEHALPCWVFVLCYLEMNGDIYEYFVYGENFGSIVV